MNEKGDSLLLLRIMTIAYNHVLTRQQYLRKVCYRYGPIWINLYIINIITNVVLFCD